MKKKNGFGFNIIFIAIFAVFAAQTAAMFFYNKILFTISIILLAISAILFLLIYKNAKRYINSCLIKGVEIMSQSHSSTLDLMAAPVLLVSWDNRAVWANKAFGATVMRRQDIIGKDIQNIISCDDYQKLTKEKNIEIVLNDKIFKAYIMPKKELNVIFFIDQTELKKIAAEYRFSRPVAAILEIDSLDDTLKDEKDSKKVQVRGHIQDIIEKWFHTAGGIMYTLSGNRFLLVFEERYLNSFEAEKFSILEKIRNYEIGGNKYLTLSIGIGHGCKNLSDCETLARRSLDMALSRGGDQVAVKSPNEDYKFYGGVKAVSEKGSRVRTRVTSKALNEIIKSAGNCLLMGHKFSDLDSLGASFAFASIAENLGKEAKIIINREETMAKSLVDYMVANGYGNVLINEKQALEMIDEDTLLIVLDTHRPSFCESAAVYKNALKTVVVDHHRKATDYIDNALLFYNETTASSTCEIATEIWQYMGIGNMNSCVAEALMAGIMLDTKNFVLGTGVRTYEAAAYLRKCSAQPVTVKKLFSDSMDVYKRKYKVISSAKNYGEYVVAANKTSDNISRIVSAQAADELLGVNNVKASFVIFKNGDSINISARSYGEFNVQLIMEKLGGGGHKTMAACTLDTIDFNLAEEKLVTAVNEYIKG